MKLLLLVLGLMSDLALASVFKFNPAQTIQIVGPIDGTKLPVMRDFERLSRSGKTIDVLINSPGGHIVVGNLIINSMIQAKSRGSKIRCVSTVLNASMAFQLFMHCDERYAMKYTKLLFHPPRIFYMGTLLENQMRDWILELDRIENQLVPDIRKVVRMPASDFWKAYHDEKLWDAQELIKKTDTGWLHIITDVQGISWQHSMQAQRRGQLKYTNGSIIYISEKAQSYLQKSVK